MIIINTLIGIIAIAISMYVSYLVGTRIARVLGIIDRNDEFDRFTKVFQTLIGAPVLVIICLAIKLAYHVGASIITTLYELIQ